MKRLAQTIADRRKKIFGESRGSLAAFAARSGIAATLLARYEKGTVTPNADKLPAIAEALQTTVAALTGEAEPVERKPHEIPIVACASALRPDGVCQITTGLREHEGVIRLPLDAEIVRVHGDSMANVVHDGQFVICVPRELAHGNLAVVETNDDRLMVKRVYFSHDEKYVHCVSVNTDPAYEPIILHRRKEVRRMRKVWGTILERQS